MGVIMNNYRLALCDDNKYYNEELNSILSSYESENNSKFEIITYISGEDLLTEWESKNFHIIFIDVEMEGKSGIDVARDIRKKNDEIIIIFVTSYPNYALNAFEVSALGYLVKPVSYDYLKKLLTKALISVNYIIEKEAIETKYLEVKVEYKNIKIDTNKILYVEKRRNASIIHTIDNEYTSYNTLTNLYDKLDIHKFVYIHQGFMVNFNMIKEVTKTTVILKDNIEIPISRKYHKEVKERFMHKIYSKAMG